MFNLRQKNEQFFVINKMLTDMVLPKLMSDDRKSGLVFLSHDQIPAPIDMTCDESEKLEPSILKCQFCNVQIGEEVYQFLVETEDEVIGHHYLCLKCHNRGVRFCQYKEDFFFQDVLIQLDDGPVIHQDLNNIIEAYVRLPDRKRKREYLKMCGLDGNIIVTLEKVNELQHE